ncbi:putative ribonuclease H-like domain-containing protein [Tanacetum coccineum]
MQRPPLFESDSSIYWKNRFKTYVKSKDLDLWHVITKGDFQPIEQNPETKLDEVIPFEKQSDDIKKRLAKNNEAKMVLYNALPGKEYERIFMCNTAKEIWKTLLITHKGNSQVKDNKIDLLVQQYEQFIISEDESINSAFDRFNTIIQEKSLYTSAKCVLEERKNRTLIEAARTMLADSKLPTTFWAEAVSTACYDKDDFNMMKDDATKSLMKEQSSDNGPSSASEDSHMEDQEIELGNIPQSYEEEPKRISQALRDPAWVEAMQEELFSSTAKGPGFLIEAIRIFLAYASYMGFMVYQMDVKSAFLYGQIEEEDKFQMSSMGELTFFLGLHVQQNKKGIFISQDKYVHEILRKFNYSDVKSASTPTDLEKPLVKDGDAADVDEHLYRSMIGSLMYLTSSRPDIMFAVCYMCKVPGFSKDIPSLTVKKSLDKLKGKPSSMVRWNSDSWQCKKQTVVATSTTEVEYVAAASCCGQLLWIQNQLLDYGYNFMDTIIYIDNTSTICIIENLVQHSKTKHIEIRHHFIRDCNAKKLIQMAKIDTQHNVADLLTKGFDAGRF